MNAEVINAFDDIENENQGVVKHNQSVEVETRKEVQRRQKLIKIADKSQDGWRVVREYEFVKLASDSKDEKKLKKARQAASKNAKHRDSGRRQEPEAY